MAKTIVCGNVAVITSDVALEDLKLIQANRPKKLNLYETDESGKKTCLFTVGVTTGKGNVGAGGIAFDSAHEGDGKAQLTVEIPAGDGMLKERVAAKYGKAVMLLNQLEPELAPVVEEIKAEQAAMLEGIQVI